jgi:hypothetical protein
VSAPQPSPPSAARRPARGDFAVLAAALLLWAWVSVPTALGQRTFYLRDVFTTHLPYKAFGARELAAGRIPAFDPDWGLGQPFRGNPNALPFYPGNLLYLALPFWSAFNLHYALHWLLAFAAMAALARALGQGRPAALVAGLTYAGSGWMLSALTFYNLLAVAAWWPLVLLGAARGGRRGLALGGLACGLALLGGEPVAAALGLAPLLLVAVSRHGARRGLATAAGIGAVGLLVALPQVVATLRVLPFTIRGGHGLSAAQAADYALHPARLLELLVPFPFGRPATIGRAGIWAVSVLPEVPLILTLYSGAVGLWLAAAAAPRRRAWALLAAAGPALAILGGAYGTALARASFGLFRYPEKFLFWLALALPLLAGWGLEEVAARRGWRRLAFVAGGLTLALAAVVWLAAPAVVAAVSARLAPAARAAAVALLSTQLVAWALALLLAGAALPLAAWAAGRGRTAAVAALQLVLLVQLRPLAATDSTAPYRDGAPWARRLAAALGRPPAVVDANLVVPPWAPDPRYELPDGPRAVLDRTTALDLGPAAGALQGLTYPLAPDLEGMQSPLFAALLQALPDLGWAERVRWFRSVGLDAAVLFVDPAVPGLTLLDRAGRHGVVSRLYAVESPAPAAWWPRRVVAAASPREALLAVSATPDPVATVVAPRPPAHDPGGRLLAFATPSPDRIDIEVEGNGGLAVLRRAYQPLFVATTGGRRLPVVPVNLNLLGVVVPPGHHRVRIEVSAWPETAAALVALLAAAAAFAALWRGRQ